MSDDPETPPAPAPAPEDIANGLRFGHAMAMQSAVRTAELSATVYSLLETLIGSGVVSLEDYERRRQEALRREQRRSRGEVLVVIDDTPDKYALTDAPKIDCSARLELCKARCCSFLFPLSTQDLDERIVRWEYGRPYEIARRPDGYCVHNSAGSCNCEVYAHRPSACRVYDCRNDRRIWIDFEARIPAVPP